MIAVLSEVEPSGASNQITAGYLLASQRALDPELATYGPKHLVVRPWHPFTKASQQAVTAERTDGIQDRDLPHLRHRQARQPAAADDRHRGHDLHAAARAHLGQSLGGTITILHDPQHPSNVLLPFAP